MDHSKGIPWVFDHRKSSQSDDALDVFPLEQNFSKAIRFGIADHPEH
jgi:hypothetical protein